MLPVRMPPTSAPRLGTALKPRKMSAPMRSTTSTLIWTTTGWPGTSHTKYPGIACAAGSISVKVHGTTMPGFLYLVATPIGNLEDVTLRALRVLREADLIACEDTRQTGKLLSHFCIDKPMVSYHEHNEATRAVELVAKLEGGANIALVSDAGTPLVSDPGYRLVTTAIGVEVPVVPIPGTSAVLSALAAAGLPTDAFRFSGFLPVKSGQRRKVLETLRKEDCTIIFYEAPH